MVKCILIVDDDPAQRRILEETVKTFGHETLIAESGDQALEILNSEKGAEINLILLDLVMPGLDGMGVLDRLRPDPASPPVIVQTANGSMDTAIGAMRAGGVVATTRLGLGFTVRLGAGFAWTTFAARRAGFAIRSPP